MLPFALVFLIAASAFAQNGINGKNVRNDFIDGSFERVGYDYDDSNIYILTVQSILNDLANQADANSQALAMSQAIAALGELATGIPGDACEAAGVANAIASGNVNAIRQAVAAWIGRVQTSIDLIVNLSNNPDSLRYLTGPRTNCAGAGKSYQFEAAWDAVLNAASPFTLPLVNEEYVAVKGLYSASDRGSNYVGAALTAASVPAVVAVFQRALTPVANFLRVLASGGNTIQAAAATAKSALVQAVSYT